MVYLLFLLLIRGVAVARVGCYASKEPRIMAMAEPKTGLSNLSNVICIVLCFHVSPSPQEIAAS